MRSLLACLLFVPWAIAADDITYNRDVRPILSDNCFPCHGPDKRKRKAKLRLDERESAIDLGALVPGKPSESELVARILLKSGEDGAMPPPEAHKVLSAGDKAILKQWVEAGAKYEPHWAYTPLVKPPVPDAKGNPIDAFIGAALAKKNLTLSPEADRRTLIRRLSLDVTGLPPSIEAVEKFVNDTRPDAYERLVDDLLARNAYGERMAVLWLDQVRFADTVGYHGDQNQRIFPYRDYVIKSFATNKPFDEFTREQLAGDLLPKPSSEQLVATGFNRLNMMTREGGAQPAEYLAKYQADRVRTVSLAWLGSTLGCAECHDHKFDPFKASDFYSMGAFFADVKQWGVYSDYSYTPNPDLRGWSNDHPFPPEIEVESEYDRQEIARLRAQLQDLAVRTQQTHRKAFDDWRRTSEAWLKPHPTGWATPPVDVGKDQKAGGDGRIVFTGKVLKNGSSSLMLKPDLARVVAVKIELLPDAAHGGKLARNGAASVTLTPSFAIRHANGKETKLSLQFGMADHREPVRWSSTSPAPLTAGWRTVRGSRQPHTAVWMLDKPYTIKPGDAIVATLKSDNIGAARVSVSPFGWDDELPPASVLGTTDATAATRWLLSTAVDAYTNAKVKSLLSNIQDCNDGKAWTQITVAQKPMTTRLLPRGNFLDDTGPVVLPSTPEFLGGASSTEGHRLTRLDLANWITRPQNPLTARVFVNRLWKLYFGTGLSAGVEDIGAQGEWPSHPELLDWLASEFRSDWNVKRIAKQILMSATYRQQSKARTESLEVDPGNRLLSFLPPRRLEAEFVRDNALAISGLLNRDLYGPSAKPYQPENYYTNLQFPNRKYVAEADRTQYRRGLYTHWQRTFLHPMLANFDAPSREECTATRTTANTPQQALTLLNDPTFVEAARVLAVKVRDAGKTDGERLDWLFQRALARTPKPREREALITFLGQQRKHYAANPGEAKELLQVGLAPPPTGDPAELAAWATVCRVVLNLHECITRY